MIGAATAETPFMDAEIAALLGVLGEVPGMPTLDLVAEANVPAVEPVLDPVEVIESGVEMLSIEDLAEIVELPIVHTDEAVSAVVAGLDLSDHYAAMPADEVPHDGASAEEIAAATVEVTPVAAPKAPKVPKAPRVHYENKTDRIKSRLGEKLGDYLVLELNDAELEGDALKAKQDETLAVIDAMSVKVKNRASLLMDFLSGKATKPNEIMKRALDCLAADGKLTTGDKGNLHLNLLTKPYSTAAARSMGRNTLTVMEKTKMIVLSTKGEYLPNPESLFLVMANQKLGTPAVEPVEAEAVEAEVEPVAEEEGQDDRHRHGSGIAPAKRRANHHAEHFANGTAGQAMNRGAKGNAVQRDQECLMVMMHACTLMSFQTCSAGPGLGQS